MQPQNDPFQFGPFILDPAERVLTRDGEPVKLTPKAFDVLLLLVSRAGRPVTKDELFKAGWPDAIVEEGNLSYTVSLLRKALDAPGAIDSYISTVQKVGTASRLRFN
jgi:DNA-binding winged helix-turn-helix (wHTH) protein